MAAPVIERIEPAVGPTSGGNLVRIVGSEFAPVVRVGFGAAKPVVVPSWRLAGARIADVTSPAHDGGAVDVVVENLDADGKPVPGEITIARGAYEYVAPAVATESDLARLVRTVVRALKRQVLANVHVAVHLDYDDAPGDTLRLTPLATLPSLVLSGPTVRPHTPYRTAAAVDVDAGTGEVLRHRPRLTTDLAFTITGASSSTVELLGLLTATAHFVSRTPWISMLRDPARPALGAARWDLDLDGDWRTQIPGPEQVHVFTAGFVIRGFDLDEGLVRERLARVDTISIHTGAVGADEGASE